MSPPGPPGPLWAVGLVLWALSIGIVGEWIRLGASRWVGAWRSPEPIERALLDLFLGGALFYLLAALPLGLFSLVLANGLPIGAGAGLLLKVGWVRRRGGPSLPRIDLGPLLRPAPLLALASAAGLYVVELAAALPVGTGNSFDSSLLTTYTALLLQHGSIPLSFHPYGTTMILYPQGSTVWFGDAQLVFGLPPARTSLLVTPLFLGLAPLSGFVFGRRAFGTDTAGAACAVTLAWLGPSTRGMAGGSNDFALAFPLVLLLASQWRIWVATQPPSAGDAAGFGLLAGYSAAINPVGAEWLLPAVLILVGVSAPALRGNAVRWVGRWAFAVATSLVGVVPSLYVLALGWRSPGFVPGSTGPPMGVRSGISAAQFFGGIDPFLFRSGDVELSPVPVLRAELAILLVVGVVVLVLAGRGTALGRFVGPFRRWSLAAVVVVVGELAVLVGALAGVPSANVFAAISSGAELSLTLFSVYALVAALLLVFAFERMRPRRTSSDDGGPRRPAVGPTRRGTSGIVPVVIALAIVVPGVVLTPTGLSYSLGTLYDDFGRASPGDFALLDYCGAHVPSGSRILVAPGSVAEFLPGYARGVVLLYPLEPGWQWVNASYTLVVSELTNGSLDASGDRALVALGVGFVVVTMQNSVLWPAFAPGPMLADPTAFDPEFVSGDAYLFGVNQSQL